MKGQNKTEQLNLLFNEWEIKVPEYKAKLVKDGIINEELYQVASRKILFITKEPNNPNQEPGDFRDWLKKEIYYSFSYRIAEWSYGILNNFPKYDEIWRRRGLAHKAIQHIALINIKKSGGGGNADYNRMMEHLKLNFNLLHRQIEIIDPEIVIIGTSWNQLRDGLFPQIEWRQSGYDIMIGKYKNLKIIDYYHPSSRTPPAASYSLLQNIITSNEFLTL